MERFLWLMRHLNFLPVVGKDNPNQSVSVLGVKNNALQVSGVKSDSGIRFDVNGIQKMHLAKQRLAIGSIPVPNHQPIHFMLMLALICPMAYL